MIQRAVQPFAEIPRAKLRAFVSKRDDDRHASSLSRALPPRAGGLRGRLCPKGGDYGLPNSEKGNQEARAEEEVESGIENGHFPAGFRMKAAMSSMT